MATIREQFAKQLEACAVLRKSGKAGRRQEVRCICCQQSIKAMNFAHHAASVHRKEMPRATAV